MLRVLNMYAPNGSADNTAFRATLHDVNLGRVDLMLGDFNVVEEAINRILAQEDPKRQPTVLDELCNSLILFDHGPVVRPAKDVHEP